MRLKADTGETVTPGRGGRVADLIEQWKDVVRLTRRPSTAKSYCRLIDSHIVPHFGKGEPRAITRNAIEQWHGKIAERTPIEANRALATLSAFMSWLEHDHKITATRAKGVRRRPENQRHIFLDADEIEAAHAALDADGNRNAALALRLALADRLPHRRGGACSSPTRSTPSAGYGSSRPRTPSRRSCTSCRCRPRRSPSRKELLRIGVPDYDACRRAWERARTIIGRPDVRIHDLRH